MKKISSIVAGLFIVFGLFPTITQAEENPSYEQMKQTIMEKAEKYDIPPEILKAIAFVETGYKQFKSDGTPNVSPDGGIGVMQVTPSNIDIAVNVERLKTDYSYNIDVAAQVLNEKWNTSYLPIINDHDRTVLEDWYFAIMAYNGASKANDPNLHPGNTYQDSVYDRIAGSSFISWDNAFFTFPTFDIRYETGSDTMKFPTGVSYETTKQTPSQQMYAMNGIVYVDERDGAVNLRSSIGGSVVTALWPYTPLKVVSGPVESPDIDNDFVYYKVRGENHTGYITSAYLNKGNESITFTDAGDDKRAAALAFLALHDYAQGYSDGTFQSSANLKREHVAVILDNILNLTKPSSYQMKADDVESDNPYYEQLAEAEYNKLLGGGGALRPKEYLTRAQMAQVMTEAFDSYYAEPTTTHTFKDQASIWNPEAVNTIYFNDVTVSDPFHPNDKITRSQFALFIYRTMVDF
ncbi:S-layer homology domain-containing protein [Radiobacillus deserti]|uniref:SLH domain-containing protein n=1 Tax=Radiobacillus deserti TaxID=2594883 RepID=A0A516KJC7_9BACI|nr:S-layer homology domain-containing protein [Radiobacillus deserti]QDP41481.1 hypothetical protein FN924_15645 [Radiobacillus deserti]